MHGLVHLPHQLAQPGKTGDILKQLLRGRGHYVALVSTMEDALAEQPKVKFKFRLPTWGEMNESKRDYPPLVPLQNEGRLLLGAPDEARCAACSASNT